MYVNIEKLKKKAIRILENDQSLDRTQQKIVAFVLDSKGKILSEGTNSYIKTHPEQAQSAKEEGEDYKIFLHAEVSALTRLKYHQLGKQETIVVLRLNNQLSLCYSKPCPICCRTIKKYGISNIIHS